MRPLRILRAGFEEHSEIDEVMRDMQQQRIDDLIPDTLILVQHPEVVTLGPKAQRDGINLPSYPTRIVDRGGGITYHGPGQLVCYPVIKWEKEEQSIRGIINRIEDWVMASLADCGVNGYRDERMMGVWVDEHKICSIGLSFKHWVSRHGTAINFDIPNRRIETLPCCGLTPGTTTSLTALGHSHDLEGRFIDRSRLEEALLKHLEEFLGRKAMVPEEWSPELVA